MHCSLELDRNSVANRKACSQGQNLRVGNPGGPWDNGMKEEGLVMTWLHTSPGPHNPPGFLGVSPGGQGSREAGR